jgi:hypothetical protein
MGSSMSNYEIEVIIKTFDDVAAALVLIQDALIGLNQRITELENE